MRVFVKNIKTGKTECHITAESAAWSLVGTNIADYEITKSDLDGDGVYYNTRIDFNKNYEYTVTEIELDILRA